MVSSTKHGGFLAPLLTAKKAVSPAYTLLGTNRYFYLAIGRAKLTGSAKVALVWPIQKLDGPNWYHLQLFWLFLSKLYNFHERVSSSYQERKLLFLSPINNRAYYPFLEHLEMWLIKNTWPTPSLRHKNDWPTPKARLEVAWPTPYLKHGCLVSC